MLTTIEEIKATIESYFVEECHKVSLDPNDYESPITAVPVMYASLSSTLQASHDNNKALYDKHMDDNAFLVNEYVRMKYEQMLEDNNEEEEEF